MKLKKYDIRKVLKALEVAGVSMYEIERKTKVARNKLVRIKNSGTRCEYNDGVAILRFAATKISLDGCEL